MSVKVISTHTKIKALRKNIRKSPGTKGGFSLTGFIDIEKLIKIKNKSGKEKVIFLEKVLPFQILELELKKMKKRKNRYYY